MKIRDQLDWLAIPAIWLVYVARDQGWLVLSAETIAMGATMLASLRGAYERRSRSQP